MLILWRNSQTLHMSIIISSWFISGNFPAAYHSNILSTLKVAISYPFNKVFSFMYPTDNQLKNIRIVTQNQCRLHTSGTYPRNLPFLEIYTFVILSSLIPLCLLSLFYFTYSVFYYQSYLKIVKFVKTSHVRLEKESGFIRHVSYPRFVRGYTVTEQIS